MSDVAPVSPGTERRFAAENAVAERVGLVGGRSVRAEVAETGGEIGGKSELALVRSPALFEPTSPPPLPFLSRLRDAQAFKLLSRYLSQLLERRA